MSKSKHQKILELLKQNNDLIIAPKIKKEFLTEDQDVKLFLKNLYVAIVDIELNVAGQKKFVYDHFEYLAIQILNRYVDLKNQILPKQKIEHRTTFLTALIYLWNFLQQLVWFSKKDYFYELYSHSEIFDKWSKLDPVEQKKIIHRQIHAEITFFKYWMKFKKALLVVGIAAMYFFIAPVILSFKYSHDLKEKSVAEVTEDIRNLGQAISNQDQDKIKELLQIQKLEVEKLPQEIQLLLQD